MSTEDNKTLVIGYIESLNQKKLTLEEFIAPGVVFHDPGMPEATDLATVQRFVADSFNAFPDTKSTVEDLVAEEDRVVLRYSSRMTHQRDFMGIPATGKQLMTSGIAIYRIAAGEIQEEWSLQTGSA
jgi:steroid delta-isomerase-like uncharacterized protein